MFSSRRCRRRVPGIGTSDGRWASSQARATCAGVASCAWAIFPTRSRSAWLAARFSSVKRGILARMSPGVNSVRGADGAGEEAPAERTEGHQADAELVERRKDLCLDVAGPQRVLALQCGHRLDGVGAADRARRRPRTARSGRPCRPPRVRRRLRRRPRWARWGRRGAGRAGRSGPFAVAAATRRPPGGSVRVGCRGRTERPSRMFQPNLVAMTTWSRSGWSASPTSSSLTYGP